MFVSMVSASLYVVALCLAMTLIVPVPRSASRAARVAQVACGICAGATIAGALASTLSGLLALAVGLGVMAAASVGVWLRLTLASGDPPTNWTQFDRDRAAWERARVPTGV